MLIITDDKNRKIGVKEYLQGGTNNDRDEKDIRVPLFGDLDILDKTIKYTQKNKDYNENYRNLVLSFNEDLDKNTMQAVVNDFINLYMVGYESDEFVAYAEAHYPKKRLNSRGEERRNHAHISIAKYSPKLNRQLDLGDHNTRLNELKTIKRYLELKYNLKSLEHNTAIKKDLSQFIPNPNLNTRKEAIEAINTFINTNIANIKDYDELLEQLQTNFNLEITNKSTTAKTPYITIKLPNIDKTIRLKGALYNPNTFNKAKESLLNGSNKVNIKTLANASREKEFEEIKAKLEHYKQIRTKIINKNYSKNRAKIKDHAELQKQTKKAKNYISYQKKILKEIYNVDFENLNLGKGYFVAKYENTGITTIANRTKSVKIIDKGNKIIAKNKNIQEQAKIAVELAKAKGWNLEELKIKGSKEWQEAIKTEIEKQLTKSSPLLATASNQVSLATPTIKTNKKTFVKAKLDENYTNKNLELLDFKTLKELLNANDLLKHLENIGILKKDNYTIQDNKIVYKNKKYNVVDFCIKHLNLSFKETNLLLNNAYRVNLKDFKKGDKMSKFDFKIAKMSINPLLLNELNINIKVDKNQVYFDKSKADMGEYRIKVNNNNYNIVDFLVKANKMSFKEATTILEEAQKLLNNKANEVIKKTEIQVKVKEKTTDNEDLKAIKEAKYLNWGELLLNQGYKQVEKGKWSKYKNEFEEVVIYKNKNGMYKYFIQDGSESGDLYDFFKNRGAKTYKDIINMLDGKKLVDNIDIVDSYNDNDEYIIKLENLSKAMLQKLKKMSSNNELEYLYNDRYLDKQIVDKYAHKGLFGITADYYKNIISKSIFVKDGEFILAGLQTKGEKAKGLLASGSEKYITILTPKDLKEDKKINLVFCESYIDGLATVEAKKLTNAVIVDIMGNYTAKADLAIKEFLDYLDINKLDVHIAFDNDEMGDKYRAKLQEHLEKYENIDNIIDLKEELQRENVKDFNELLVKQKLAANEIKRVNSKFKHLAYNSEIKTEEREIK